MADAIQIPQTLQELDEAVNRYNAADWQGEELYQRWQAIRDASLEQLPAEDPFRVLGEDSY